VVDVLRNLMMMMETVAAAAVDENCEMSDVKCEM
jgi:hypothetical protein